MVSSKLSRNDWIVVAGMALVFLAMLVARLDEAAVIAWLFAALAAIVAGLKAAPGAKLELPFSQGVIIMALGAVSFVSALFSAAAVAGAIGAAIVVFGGFLTNAETL
jgi:hypothetical protein